MSEVPVLPIGVLPLMPLPMVGLLMLELEGEALVLVVSIGGVEGEVVDGLMPVDAGVLLDDEGVVVVEPVSSTFLPQAPSASSADRATAVATVGLNFENCIFVSFG